MRVGIYIRVSTQEQSSDLQQTELLRYASARGWEVHAVFADKATGTNDNRPQLKALLKAARSREIDVLLVWKLDRLFRSLRGMIETLQDLQALSVSFVSLKDQIDMSTPSGRLMTHMLAAFAEFEAALIKERVMAGLREARRKGIQLGRPASIDRSKVIELKASGKSYSQIAKEVGCSKAGVFKILKAK